MDDNRRNYNEQEGDYFGKRFPQDNSFQRGEDRINPQRQPFDRNVQNGNFNNQQQGFVNNQNNMQRQYPGQMQNGQGMSPMRQPQQMQQAPQQMQQMPQQMQQSPPHISQQIPQGQIMPNFNNGYGYNQGGFANQMQSNGQNMSPQMMQMPPNMPPMAQMPPQMNGGFYSPANQYFVQPDNNQKRKNGIFGKGKKTLEEDFNEDMHNVIITYPKTFTDVQSIIDSLRSRQAIIVDLTKINDSTSQRILDYLSGAIYALGGSQQRIADNMFLFTPDGVSIQGPSDLKRKYD